jgi:choline transport protein
MYLCPLYVPVTIATIDYMNWSCAIVGATIVFPGIWWIYKGRFTYIKEGNSVLSDNLVIIDGMSMQGAEALREAGTSRKHSRQEKNKRCTQSVA